MQTGPTASWAEASTQAVFAPHVLETPHPELVWAGRFGVAGSKTVSLEVVAKAGDSEVATETHLLSSAPPLELHLRLLVHELLRIAVPFEEAPLALPMSLPIDAEDRVIIVQGRDVTFKGVRLRQAWAGVGEVDENVGLRVVVDGSLDLASIRVLSERSLPDYQPD